jgi:hypothetical protein
MNATTESISNSGANTTTTVPTVDDDYHHEAYTPLASNLVDCFISDIDSIVDNAAVQFTTATGWLSTYLRDRFRGDMHGGFATLLDSMDHKTDDHAAVTTVTMASLHDNDTDDGRDAMQDDHETTVPFEYMTEMQDRLYRVRAKHKLDDVERVRPYLAWLPARVVTETLKRTTQLAKAVVRYPMVRHLKSRFANLQMPRLKEIVAMDTFFASEPAYQEGFMMVQVFYGMSSHMINVYGMRRKDQVKLAIQDFLREKGAPWAFRMDGAKEQGNDEIDTILRDLHIAKQTSEPYNQQQNPAELRAVKWLKQHVQVLMDRTGAPA